MSSSASSSGSTASTSMASLYECPACFEYISPPIYQCSNGHMVCFNCSPKLDRCPSCQGPLGTCRNLFMEKALSYVRFPCKFSADGCQVTMLLAEKSAHEENCLLRSIIYSCPFKPGCNWQGNMDQMLSHFLSQHQCVKITQGDQLIFPLEAEFLSNYPGTWYWFRLQNCYDHHFLFIVKKERKELGYEHISAAVRLIGTDIEAKNFSYKLKLSCGDRPQLQWKATPLAIDDVLDSSHECLVLDRTAISQIVFKKSELIFNVKIERYSIDSV